MRVVEVEPVLVAESNQQVGLALLGIFAQAQPQIEAADTGWLQQRKPHRTARVLSHQPAFSQMQDVIAALVLDPPDLGVGKVPIVEIAVFKVDGPVSLARQ